MTDQTAISEVLETAKALVAAFGRHDRQAYFGFFADDAQFLFHTVDHLIENRAAYENLWAAWEAQDGFHVLSCVSSERHVKLAGDCAIFTHRVETRALLGGAEQQSREWETIVFRKAGDRGWMAIHEHLSLDAAG
jgi:ketosteroid isomerase-like protein